MDISFCWFRQHNHYCLSVSACIYLALGVHSIVITAFLCQHGYILPWVFTTKSLLPFCISMGVLCSVFTAKSYCLSVSAWMYRALGVHNQVITSFLCQHVCIVLWVFTTKSLLPFCVSTDVLCSGCSQPSHYCLTVSAWMYRALGVHSQVITAFLSQHGCILLWVLTTKSLLPFFVSNIAKSPFYYDILAAERTIWGSPQPYCCPNYQQQKYPTRKAYAFIVL
ncbi:hypothetical protein DPMN_002455 [Dreissena polymorpha]|uniref:Uncharacterized protein n=1 Tax=Dreissena polymorpha TaxID=45954 RepID=A0A9D4MLC2_DREPO|nr:hypothetical protein DPMN_002455 [Dreissena polymorpha]